MPALGTNKVEPSNSKDGSPQMSNRRIPKPHSPESSFTKVSTKHDASHGKKSLEAKKEDASKRVVKGDGAKPPSKRTSSKDSPTAPSERLDDPANEPKDLPSQTLAQLANQLLASKAETEKWKVAYEAEKLKVDVLRRELELATKELDKNKDESFKDGSFKSDGGGRRKRTPSIEGEVHAIIAHSGNTPRQITTEVTAVLADTDPLKIRANSKELKQLTAPAIIIPEDTADSLKPFYSVTSGDGKLHKFELDACLLAIGMRKSVLGLAQLATSGSVSFDQHVLADWWGSLHTHSKIVVGSKLRLISSEHHSTVLALGILLAGSKRQLTCPSAAALDAALTEAVGVEDGAEKDAMLQCAHSVALASGVIPLLAWCQALPPSPRASLMELLLDEEGSDGPRVFDEEVQTTSPTVSNTPPPARTGRRLTPREDNSTARGWGASLDMSLDTPLDNESFNRPRAASVDVRRRRPSMEGEHDDRRRRPSLDDMPISAATLDAATAVAELRKEVIEGEVTLAAPVVEGKKAKRTRRPSDQHFHNRRLSDYMHVTAAAAQAAAEVARLAAAAPAADGSEDVLGHVTLQALAEEAEAGTTPFELKAGAPSVEATPSTMSTCAASAADTDAIASLVAAAAPRAAKRRPSQEMTDDDRTFALSVLKEHSQFAGATDFALEKAVAAMELRTVEAGEMVVRQGEQGDELFIVRSGEFVVLLVDVGEAPVVRYRSGKMFGELAMMNNGQRFASVKCEVGGLVLTMGRAAYNEVAVAESESNLEANLRLLKSVPVLAGLTAQQLEGLCSIVEEETYVNGETVATKGAAMDSLFIVKQGLVRTEAEVVMRRESFSKERRESFGDGGRDTTEFERGPGDRRDSFSNFKEGFRLKRQNSAAKLEQRTSVKIHQTGGYFGWQATDDASVEARRKMSTDAEGAPVTEETNGGAPAPAPAPDPAPGATPDRSSKRLSRAASSPDMQRRGSINGEREWTSTFFSVGESVVLRLQHDALADLLGELAAVLRENATKTKLGSAAIFRSLSSAELDELLESAGEARFTTGDQIISQGEENADTMYIIRTGAVRVSSAQAGSRVQREVAELTTGNYFGEMAVLTGAPRTATVIALEPTVCATLDLETVEKVLAGPLQDVFEKEATRREEELRRKVALESFNRQDLVELGMLGFGTYGKVHLVEHKTSNGVYALKAMRKKQLIAMRRVEHVKREKTLMYACDHPFLVQLMGAFQDPNCLYMVVEPALGGELFTLMTDEGRLSEPMARFYAASVGSAFEHMHDRNIVYRDLKPENLLLDRTGYLKICDFGFAKVVTEKTYTFCGTPEYLAPELITNTGHTLPVDWWALGILLYEMTVGSVPFSADHPIKLYKLVLTAPVRFPNHTTRNLRSLISGLLTTRVEHRLGTFHDSEVLEHTFFHKKINMAKLLARQVKAPWVPDVRDERDLTNFNVAEEDMAEFGVVRPEWDEACTPAEQKIFAAFSLDAEINARRPSMDENARRPSVSETA